MTIHSTSRLTSLAAGLFVALAACGGSGDDGTDPTTDPQRPPQGAALVTPWLDAAYYQAWNCEAAPHAAREPSPHGTNRICNNDVLAAAADSSSYPVGSASVKELYEGEAIVGYAVYRKLAEGTDGSNWYWYETMGGTAVADGTGDNGPAKEICVGCHSHAPTDFVFTLVP